MKNIPVDGRSSETESHTVRNEEYAIPSIIVFAVFGIL
jgi:hypothetical protein